MKILFVGLLLLVTSACAHWDLHLESQANKYLGKPLEAMYDEYGAPVNSAPLVTGGNYVQFQGYRGNFMCTANVKTDSKGIIQSISTGGQNGCITGRY